MNRILDGHMRTGGRDHQLSIGVLLLLSFIGTFGFVQAVLGTTFELSVGQVHGHPGQDGVLVPVLLTNSDSVGGWDLTMEYDTSGCAITGVQLLDSIQAVDPIADTLRWYYAPWHGHAEWEPEYINLTTNYQGPAERVRVIGIMGLAGQIPPLFPGQDQLLFSFTFDLTTSWNSDTINLWFCTNVCTDNTISSAHGHVLWGPDTLSAPPSTCPIRSDTVRVIRLVNGPGIAFEPMPPSEFLRADANADMTIEMSDAVFTLKALYVPGSDSLSCLDAGDSNDNGEIAMSDAVYTLKYLYVPGSPQPSAPFPECGVDPTADEVDCVAHPCFTTSGYTETKKTESLR